MDGDYVRYATILTHSHSGKVRELYKINDSSLLMAVTDRISAYDEILSNGVPDKGHILCQMSCRLCHRRATWIDRG